MNLFKIIIDIIGISFELYFSLIFFDFIYGKPDKKRKLICGIAYVIIMGVSVLVPQFKTFIPILCLFSTFILSFAFDSTVFSRISYSTILFLSFLLSEMIVGLSVSKIMNITVEKAVGNLYYYACGVLFSKFIVFIILKIIKAVKNESVNASTMTRIPQLIVLPVSTLYTVLVIFYLSYENENETVLLLTVVAVIILIVADIFTINIIDKIRSSEINAQKLHFMERQLELQSSHYEEIINKQKEISKTKHDMNNFLISISGYIAAGNIELALDKINNQVGVIAKKNYYKCNNNCVEALINAKYKQISCNNITFDFKSNLPPKVAIDDIELCIVIGNILDNAIEACEKIDAPNNKTIRLSVIKKGYYISISQTNTVSEKHPPKNDFSTIKSNFHNHGYGLKNIKEIATKHDGTVYYEYKDNTFFTSVMLKLE